MELSEKKYFEGKVTKNTAETLEKFKILSMDAEKTGFQFSVKSVSGMESNFLLPK